MKNWRLAYRIAFINCAIVVAIGIIAGLLNVPDFAFALGLICLGGGLLNLFLSFIAYISGSKEWAKGFLLSGGILLLLSGISCGTGFSYSG
jgi:hypothetical protein